MSQTALFKITVPPNATGNWFFGFHGLTEMTDLIGLRMAANAYYPGTVAVNGDLASGFEIEFPTVYQPDTTGMGMPGYDADGTPILPVSGVLTDAEGNPAHVTVEILRRNVWEPEVVPEPTPEPQPEPETPQQE